MPKTVVFAMHMLAIAIFLPRPVTALPKQDRSEFDRLWMELLSPDELVAARALLQFAQKPKRDVTFYLGERLKPLILTKEQAKRMLSSLGGNNEEIALAAFNEFLYLDPRLAFNHAEMDDALTGPAADKLAALLCELPVDYRWHYQWHFYSPDNEVYWFNEPGDLRDREVAIDVKGIGSHGQRMSWVRAVRAIGLLEHIGTSDARAILRKMETGHADASPTKAAQEALKRLKKASVP